MDQPAVYPLDLNFKGRPRAICVYVIPHREGIMLVESGPGSTLPAIQAGLKTLGFSVEDVTHILLTHIHLDHAGASGWFARQGAQVCVHPNGAVHMLDPRRLIASATRIYGDLMRDLWGDFLPVPEERLIRTYDGMQIEVGGLQIRVLDTPGHAAHHNCYVLGDIGFAGDVGGIRMPGYTYVGAPLVPPELHFGLWKRSIQKLQEAGLSWIALTHYGIFDDPGFHLQAVLQALDAAENWLESLMQRNPTLEELRVQAVNWHLDHAHRSGADDQVLKAYAVANPTHMAGDAMYRYWHKIRAESRSSLSG